MCGKDLFYFFLVFMVLGSPPHVRERLLLGVPDVKSGGITPACAGKTEQTIRPFVYEWDHPRMCGKDYACGHEGTVSVGSPPHVRERPDRQGQDIREVRITPACAGKTQCSRAWHSQLWDHPRMCGKDVKQEFTHDAEEGSPPHVRERPFLANRSIMRPRITPACAGKTK